MCQNVYNYTKSTFGAFKNMFSAETMMCDGNERYLLLHDRNYESLNHIN